MDIDDTVIKLYSQKILELASNIPLQGQLEEYDATAKARSPLCGSNITVQLRVSQGTIYEFAQDVKACALGQAAAALVGKNIIGANYSTVKKARDQLHEMLKHGSSPPDKPFEDLDILRPAKDYKNRHASIMLALDATLDAFKLIKQTN